MNTNFLFPHWTKQIGWILLIPGVILSILFLLFESEISFFDASVFAVAKDNLFGPTYLVVMENNILDELACILFILGALLVAFSKEQAEDEYIAQIRLASLVWATYVNYAILILAILFVYDFTFFWVLVFNMFTLLTFFLIRFNWALYRAKKQLAHEE
jgi:hypothetical protein